MTLAASERIEALLQRRLSGLIARYQRQSKTTGAALSALVHQLGVVVGLASGHVLLSHLLQSALRLRPPNCLLHVLGVIGLSMIPLIVLLYARSDRQTDLFELPSSECLQLPRLPT